MLNIPQLPLKKNLIPSKGRDPSRGTTLVDCPLAAHSALATRLKIW
jgi:hypothetical protein